MVNKLLAYSFVASAAALGTFFITHALAASPSSVSETSTYPHINPAVIAGLDKHFIINFRPLRKQFEEIQSRFPQKTFIYFAYLNNAAWIGINEREEFTAASTIKVPLAMALLKAVEDGKIQLEDSYGIEDFDLDYNFGDLYKEGAGQQLTVDELLAIMLEQSDNTAQVAVTHIFNRIGITDPLWPVYGALGWEFGAPLASIGTTSTYSKISLKTLANLFLSLYDAKYVSVEHSNKILAHLAHTPFKDKIEAGVPREIAVSHKIGVAVPDDTYSDCGIVYAPNRPYLLCLGSVGAPEEKAVEFMKEISKAAYAYVIGN